MKKFFLLAATLVTFFSTHAQLFFSQPFGKTQEEVRLWLKKNPNLRVVAMPDGLLQVFTDTYTVTYSFYENGLYRIQTMREFDHKKEATQKTMELRQYFSRLYGNISDVSLPNVLEGFSAGNDHEFIQVRLRGTSKKTTQLEIVETDRALFPLADTREAAPAQSVAAVPLH